MSSILTVPLLLSSSHVLFLPRVEKYRQRFVILGFQVPFLLHLFGTRVKFTQINDRLQRIRHGNVISPCDRIPKVAVRR